MFLLERPLKDVQLCFVILKSRACKVDEQTCDCDDSAAAACHTCLRRSIAALMRMVACTHSHVDAVPTGACTACRERQLADRVMLCECVAAYANSHDEQQASAEPGA